MNSRLAFKEVASPCRAASSMHPIDPLSYLILHALKSPACNSHHQGSNVYSAPAAARQHIPVMPLVHVKSACIATYLKAAGVGCTTCRLKQGLTSTATRCLRVTLPGAVPQRSCSMSSCCPRSHSNCHLSCWTSSGALMQWLLQDCHQDFMLGSR